MSNISFGERIRRNRIRNAWSQTELAEKAGVSQMTVSNWETGKATPKPDQRKLALEVLGISKEQSEIKQADIPLEQEQQGPSAFGSWLSRVRLERKMSVGELAIKAGLSAPAIYNIESGRIENPRTETVRRLEQALGEELPSETKEEIREEATVAGVGEFFEFDPLNKGDWPDVPGIYVLYDISEGPIYVGQGSSIKSRIKEHEEKFGFKSPIVSTAAYIRVQDADLRIKFETILIRFLKRNAVINRQHVER